MLLYEISYDNLYWGYLWDWTKKCFKCLIEKETKEFSKNLSDQKQVSIACNYTNLQPLWASDNLKKGTK